MNRLRKYICHSTNIYSASGVANFISNKLGKDPDKYELITILPEDKDSKYFNVFYKEFIDDECITEKENTI